jgi:hypothetical protein
MSVLEELTKCGFCKNVVNDPLQIPCGHSFCKACLNGNVKAGKLECATCRTTHTISGSIEKILKPSQLSSYLVLMRKEHFEQLIPANQEEGVIEGTCECMPPQKPPPAVKKGEEPKPTPEVPKIHMSLCFHCQKTLCDKCRSKHYSEFKEKPLKALEGFQEGSSNVLNTGSKKKHGKHSKFLISLKLSIFVKKGN